MSEEILMDLQRTVGQIEGKLDGLSAQLGDVGGKVDGIDSRLRSVERSSLLSGAISGGFVAVGIGLIKQKMGL